MKGLVRTGVVIGTLIAMPTGCGNAVLAQQPPSSAPQPAGGGTTSRSAQELEQLVGRVALYPDDLLAIVLPASTTPLDIVQADRFLMARKSNEPLQPSDKWDASVRALLNYPEVVSMMSRDLDWTIQLGEAVTTQQADVMAAVQSFRAKTSAAGNLASDDKMLVTKEEQIITIMQQDPQVIYVPQYNPATVVVQQPVPVPYAYYPTPYPCYYYPYPPGAAFATGVFFGAATAFAFNWGGHHIEHDVDIDRTSNINVNRDNPQAQQRVEQARQQGQQRRAESGRPQQSAGRASGGGSSRAWSPPASGSQLGAARGGAAGSAAGQGRTTQQPSPGAGAARPQTGASRPGGAGASPSTDGGFGSYSRGQDTARFSNRGQQSRGSMSASPRGGAGAAGSRGGARGGRR